MGSLPRDTPKMVKKKSVRIEAETLLTAANDQSLYTKYHETRIFEINQDSKCVMCKKSCETVFHILSMCTKYLLQMTTMQSHFHT